MGPATRRHEHELPTGAGQLIHLYRHQSAFGNVRRWVVGPTPGSEGGLGVAQCGTASPMDAGREWKVWDGTEFASDRTFRFTEPPRTGEEEGSEEEVSEEEDESGD